MNGKHRPALEGAPSRSQGSWRWKGAKASAYRVHENSTIPKLYNTLSVAHDILPVPPTAQRDDERIWVALTIQIGFRPEYSGPGRYRAGMIWAIELLTSRTSSARW